MSVILLIGRILFIAIFLVSAIGNLTKAKAMAGYAASKGVPAANLAVPVGGVLLMLGSISVAFGIWGDLGALLLLIFLVPTTFLMHAFWKETDPGAKMNERVSFNKNLSLIGAALVLIWVFAQSPALSITGPLF